MNTTAPAIATIRFVVREPVTTNAGYRLGQAHGEHPFVFMFLSSEAKRFKSAIASAGLAARIATPDWPAEPLRVKHARLSLNLANCRANVDGPRKFARDALEGVLWDTDRIVEDGPAPLSTFDGGDRCIELVVELLALRSAIEMQRIRERRLRARIRALAKPRATPRPASTLRALSGLPAHLRKLVEIALGE